MGNIKHFGFNPKNYRILIVGLIVNILGFILMIGGGSKDPNQFDGEALFSPVRITLAPFLIVLGYVIIFYAIMKKNSNSSTSADKKDLTEK